MTIYAVVPRFPVHSTLSQISLHYGGLVHGSSCGSQVTGADGPCNNRRSLIALHCVASDSRPMRMANLQPSLPEETGSRQSSLASYGAVALTAYQ